MRIVTRVRIGHFSYHGDQGVHDTGAGVWRYPVELRLSPLVDRGDGNGEVQPDEEELAAIGRMVGDLTHATTIELPEGAAGAEPASLDVGTGALQWMGALQATALQAVGRELVPAYLREVEA